MKLLYVGALGFLVSVMSASPTVAQSRTPERNPAAGDPRATSPEDNSRPEVELQQDEIFVTQKGIHTVLGIGAGISPEPDSDHGGQSLASMILGAGKYWLTGRVTIAANVNRTDHPIRYVPAIGSLIGQVIDVAPESVYARPILVKCGIGTAIPSQADEPIRNRYYYRDRTEAFISPFNETTLVLQAPLEIGDGVLNFNVKQTVELVCIVDDFGGPEANYVDFFIEAMAPRLSALKVEGITLHQAD